MSDQTFDTCRSKFGVLAVLIVLSFMGPSLAQAKGPLCLQVFTSDQRAPVVEKTAIENRIDSTLRALGVSKKYWWKIQTTKEELGDSLISANLMALAQEDALLNQTDPRLKSKGLLVPNGGLCASACAVNLLGAVAAKEGSALHFNTISATLAEIIVKQYPEFLMRYQMKGEEVAAIQSGEALTDVVRVLFSDFEKGPNDARFGASTRVLTSALEPVFAMYDVSLQAEQKGTLQNMKEASSSDSIMVVSAELFDSIKGRRATIHGRHALIVLKVLPATKEILVSDPNNPNFIYRTGYFEVNGSISFVTKIRYTKSPTIAVIDTMEVVTRHEYSYTPKTD